MTMSLHITIADAVYYKISELMLENGATNRSEFVEELIRTGIITHSQRELRRQRPLPRTSNEKPAAKDHPQNKDSKTAGPTQKKEQVKQ